MREWKITRELDGKSVDAKDTEIKNKKFINQIQNIIQRINQESEKTA